MGFFFKKKESSNYLDIGLEKTRSGFFAKIARAITGKAEIDGAVLENIEEALILSDVGVDTTIKIIERLKERASREKKLPTDRVMELLREEILAMLDKTPAYKEYSEAFDFSKKPYVIMVVGVNGAGKTTTIGKIAALLRQQGKSVLIGAGDTFRAAAIEQLEVWAQRAGVELIKQQQGADPAAVAFDTVKAAVARGVDVALIDTAGRLQNKANLMAELSKIKRVMQKVGAAFPSEVLLVLDGSTGQNALRQAEEFSKATEVSSLAITKLDGSAKGGVVISIASLLNIPIKFIGVGEKIEQLQLFDKQAFIDSIIK